MAKFVRFQLLIRSLSSRPLFLRLASGVSTSQANYHPVKLTRCSQGDVNRQRRIGYRVSRRYRTNCAGREWRYCYYRIRLIDYREGLQSRS